MDLVLDFSWTWKIRSHGRRISRFAAAALQLLLATLPGLALELQIHLPNYMPDVLHSIRVTEIPTPRACEWLSSTSVRPHKVKDEEILEAEPTQWR